MATKKSAPAKYTDKSGGKPELQSLFERLKQLVGTYEKGSYRVKANKPGQYELYFDNAVEIAGRKYPELAFAGLLIQKGYVGFYFFPVYVDETLKEAIGAELLKTLKGKTCFHIKRKDAMVFTQIQEALSLGYKAYAGRGWK